MRLKVLSILLAGLAMAPAWAQNWPSRQVTIVSPFAAGSGVDLLARLVGNELQDKLGQPFIVDDRAGANGNVGASFASKAAPDGNTLLIVTPGITEQRQRSRRELLHSLDTLGTAMKGNSAIDAYMQSEGQAYDLILGDAGKVFDLSQETNEMREAYGRNTFGQACLAARRLVERGVPYITINFQGWDTHKQHFQTMRQRLPWLDKGMSTLLTDLTERGLLDSTVLWWSGEFGRTPKVLWEPPWNGGRGHWGQAFSAVLAGGGFKGGHVIGSTDARGEEVRERPVYPEDVIRSIYTQLGLDPESKLPNPDGDDIRLAPRDASRPNGLLQEIM